MLLAIPRFRVDLFQQLKTEFGTRVEFFVPESVIQELEFFSKKGLKGKIEYRIIKEVMEKNFVKIVDAKAKEADLALLELSQQGFYIASNDKELRKKIKTVRGKNIYLKRKRFIEIE